MPNSSRPSTVALSIAVAVVAAACGKDNAIESNTNSVCARGETTCRGDDLYVCNASLTGFDLLGTCLSGTCVQGKTTCPGVDAGSGGSGGEKDASAGAGGSESGGSSGSGGAGEGGANGEGGHGEAGGSAGASGEGGGGGADAGAGGAGTGGKGGGAGTGGVAGASGTGGGAGAGGSAGTDGGACGHLLESCCPGDVCLSVNTDCTGGVCQTCGAAKGDPCCGGTTCGGDLTCVGTTCTCGGKDTKCCGGTSCDPGLGCKSGTCTCGQTTGDTCCPGSPPTCGANLVCAGEKCSCYRDACGAPASAGSGQQFVLRADGTVWSRGSWSALTLENGTPVTGVKAISRSCLISGADGAVQCWGTTNQLGQLGRGNVDTPPSSFVAPVLTGPSTPLKGAVRITGGYDTNCAVTADEKLYCWGSNYSSNGILTTGLPKSEWAVAVQASDGVPFTGVKEMSNSQVVACAIKTDNTAWCWGSNGSGSVGIGTTDPVRYPAQVTALSNKVKQIDAAGPSAFAGPGACAVVMDGTLWCWGDNSSGAIGNGVTGGTVKVPSQVVKSLGGPALDNVVQTMVGSQGAGDPFALGSCALRSDHTMWCWGNGGVINPTQVKSGVARIGQMGVFIFYLNGEVRLADTPITLPCP